jgi:hypothetical protein
MLSMLDFIPERTVYIFTTNKPRDFEQRTLDRMRRYEFSSAQSVTSAGAQAYCDLIWNAETGGEDGPDWSELPNVLVGSKLSLRRVATAMEQLVRYGAPLEPKRVAPPSRVFLAPKPEPTNYVVREPARAAIVRAPEPVAVAVALPVADYDSLMGDLDLISSSFDSDDDE